MPDCDHKYTLESIETPEGTEPGNGIRTAWLICELCAHRQSRLTRRTDAQIEAELAEIQS